MAGSGRKWNCAGKFAGATGSCVGPATRLCGSCGAVSYCSQSHQRAHWKVHREECSRMAQQMAHADLLNDFPFSFNTEATHLVDVGTVTLCSFLEERQLHLKGLWQGECGCADTIFTSCFPAGWELPSPMSPCTEPREPSGRWLTDWSDYYSWRNLSFNSPAAILLHWSLSLYYAIGVIAKRMQESGRIFGSAVRVHYLGPENELRIVQVFGELMALIPGTRVYIDMIGPAVPGARDGEILEIAEYPKCLDSSCKCKMENTFLRREAEAKGKSVQVQLWRGLYHDRFTDLIHPDIVVAPNAGLAAFPSWAPTMKLLSSLGTPTFITDYCEEAADLAAHSVSLVHSEPLTYPVQPNPFREPFSHQEKTLNLPTFSNGFIFGFN